MGAREPAPERQSSDEGIADERLERLFRAAKPTLCGGFSWLPEGTLLLGGRIQVIRRLGSGAMGAVYEARDRGGRVAVKALHNLNPDQLYRLKNEFRFLAGVAHPNVIVVHELFAEGDLWFFSMEAVQGLPLDRYWVLHTLSVDAQGERGALSEANVPLLRELLQQVIEGVAAIHDAGLVHRDLKPTNVLVEESGRVVILDFGLVSDQVPGGIGQTVPHAISGTPGFMAPEQAAGQQATMASDWYGVGVMLYQLLTQRLPHQGSMAAVLRAKQDTDAQRPSVLAPETPPDLDALCMQLLQRDPERRPTTEQMRALGREWSSADASARPSREASPHCPASFVGRRDVLMRLETLYRTTRTGKPVLATIRAESGMGKTRLLNYFIEYLQRIDDACVLHGRCREREAVPYKAFDEVFDNLTRAFLRLSEDQVAQLVPRHAHTLARLFPVLLRVDAFRQAAQGTQQDSQEAQLQRLGFAAVREMLCRISDRRPLVLVIDDLQWADVDSVRLLAEILAPPEPPNVLIVCSYRAEEQGNSIIREALNIQHVEVVQLSLGPLRPQEALELARLALPTELADQAGEAELVARESRGIPLYLLELAHSLEYVRASGERSPLLGLIQRRIAQLPQEARTILELAALAGRPLPRQIVLHICDPEIYPTALAALRAAKLTQLVGDRMDEALEPYHERVREAVLATFNPKQASAHHATLAQAIEAQGIDDPEWLAQHLRGAGQLERAQHLVVQAARLAMNALAFNRAADLYELALELDDREPTQLYRELGDALARAGRGAQAADAYLDAARSASRREAQLLEGLAASQWLRVGHLEQAVRLLRAVLERNDLPWPESVAESVIRLLINRARIRASNLRFELRREEDVPRELLDKLDALYPAQTALGTFDYLRGAVFATMALPLALKAGEPKRLVTALGSEAIYSVMLDGLNGTERSAQIRDSIDKISSSMVDPYGIGVAQLTAALCGYWSGHWSKVTEPSLKAEEVFSQRVAGGTWEATLVRSVRHTVLVHAGALPTLASEVPGALFDAIERSDRYAELDLMRSMIVVHLRNDHVDGAFQMLDRMRALLERFPLVSLAHLVLSANVATHLYAGRVLDAQALLAKHWEDCRKVALHRFPLVRLTYLGMRANCLRADDNLASRARVQELRKLARAAGSESVAWGKALAHQIEGFALIFNGDGTSAARAFERAGEGFLASGLHLDAAIARYEQSQYAPPLKARELGLDAQRTMVEQGIVKPERWAAMIHSVY